MVYPAVFLSHGSSCKDVADFTMSCNCEIYQVPLYACMHPCGFVDHWPLKEYCMHFYKINLLSFI